MREFFQVLHTLLFINFNSINFLFEFMQNECALMTFALTAIPDVFCKCTTENEKRICLQCYEKLIQCYICVFVI